MFLVVNVRQLRDAGSGLQSLPTMFISSNASAPTGFDQSVLFVSTNEKRVLFVSTNEKRELPVSTGSHEPCTLWQPGAGQHEPAM